MYTKTQQLGKTSAATAVTILRHLYAQPIIDIGKIQEWTGVSTRTGAQKIIDRLIKLDILVQRDTEAVYGRTYEYRSYLTLFQK